MMVDLEGQQRGLLTKAFWKLMPFSTNCLVVCCMYVELRSSLRMSSVMMKIMLGFAAVWAGATGAFHNIRVATQAAAAATPMINISAKRTCPLRCLLACIFTSPFFLTTLLPFCVATSVLADGSHLSPMGMKQARRWVKHY